MKTQNVKCPVCGYIFEANTEAEKGTCPLCSEEYKTANAIELFEKNSEHVNAVNNERSAGRIIFDWCIFGVCLAIFIVILTCIFEFIMR